MGDAYVEALRKLCSRRIPGQSDLCCYWFERARAEIEAGRCKRAGLLATQGIRGGANREVLKRIKATGDIFFAESDRPWVLNGASVHVSMVAFDGGQDQRRVVDGASVEVIYANLSATTDAALARPLPANAGLCYLGVMKAGPFDVTDDLAMRLLQSPNPHGLPTSDVLRPCVTAADLLHRSGKGWIIDFGVDRPQCEAALYDDVFDHVQTHVEPMRRGNNRARLANEWWLHGEPRPGMRHCLNGLARFVVTPEVSKHRVFAWLDAVFLPDHQTRALGSCSDTFFGILHSRLHEVWARAQGIQSTREGERLPLHAHHLLRDLPVPRAHSGAGGGHRRSRPAARRAPHGLAQPARVDPRGGAGVPRLRRRPLGPVCA